MLLLDAWIGRDEDLPQDPRGSADPGLDCRTRDGRQLGSPRGCRRLRQQAAARPPAVDDGALWRGGRRRKLSRRSDLKRETEWNTYVIKGLPKTPICNPSRDSIDAVMHPAKQRTSIRIGRLWWPAVCQGTGRTQQECKTISQGQRDRGARQLKGEGHRNENVRQDIRPRRASRPDAGPVIAVRGRQDLHRAKASRGGWQFRVHSATTRLPRANEV